MGEISETYSGGTPKVSIKSFYNKKEIPFIRSSDIHKNTTELYITKEGLEESSAKLVSKGQILYALYGATSGEVDISKIDGAINQAILAINTHDNINYFIMLFLNKNKDKIIKKYIQGGQGNLSAKIVKNININITSKKEEKEISTFIKKFEKIFTLYERKKELLKKFQQGFSDILFKKNPKECVSLGDYFYFNKGKNIGNKDLINNGKYYAIVYGELYTTYNYVISKVFSKTSIKGFKGRKNDLLFPSSSTVPFGTATCSALEIDNIELGNDIIVARPKNTNELDSAFISYQINSKRKILYPIISGTTITHMYSKDLSKIRIWLPNITTQNYISNILQRISHLNILVDKKVNILKEIKKEFLNTMFI